MIPDNKIPGKRRKWVLNAAKIITIGYSHAGGHWFESSSLHQSESLVVVALQGIPTFYIRFICPQYTDNFPACVTKCWVILGL